MILYDAENTNGTKLRKDSCSAIRVANREANYAAALSRKVLPVEENQMLVILTHGR